MSSLSRFKLYIIELYNSTKTTLKTTHPTLATPLIQPLFSQTHKLSPPAYENILIGWPWGWKFSKENDFIIIIIVLDQCLY